MSTRRPRVPVPVEPVPIDPEPAAVNPAVDGEGIVGELLVADEPAFSASVISEDGRNRVARTGVQAGGASGAVILVRYLFVRYLPSHLPPDEVLLALVALVAWAGARVQNASRIRGNA